MSAARCPKATAQPTVCATAPTTAPRTATSTHRTDGVATVVGAVAGWWCGYWSLAGRVHQTVLALLAVGFVWQLSALGFLPW